VSEIPVNRFAISENFMQHSQQLKKKLPGWNQSAGTRTIVISLIASFRLVWKGNSEAFFRS
jgi:hypothetical protein